MITERKQAVTQEAALQMVIAAWPYPDGMALSREQHAALKAAASVLAPHAPAPVQAAPTEPAGWRDDYHVSRALGDVVEFLYHAKAPPQYAFAVNEAAKRLAPPAPVAAPAPVPPQQGAEPKPQSITLYNGSTDEPYIDIDGADLFCNASDFAPADRWKIRFMVDAAKRALSQQGAPEANEEKQPRYTYGPGKTWVVLENPEDMPEASAAPAGYGPAADLAERAAARGQEASATWPEPKTDCGLSSITYGSPTYVARFELTDKVVRISGAGYVPGDGELKTAVGFHNLTVKQATALSLGLQVLEFLRTGEYASAPNLETEPGAALNYSGGK